MEWLGHLPKKLPIDPEKEILKLRSLKVLDQKLIKCDACPRLVQWREEISEIKRRVYSDQKYWGKPVTGFGP